MIFVLIMQDQSYLREAITSFLRSEFNSIDVLTVARPEELDEISEETASGINLVLVHVGHRSADNPCVLEQIDAVRARITAKPIVLLGDAANDRQFRLALDHGTSGYIPAGTPADIVKHVLPIIANGGIYAPPFVFGSSPRAADAVSGFAEENAEDLFDAAPASHPPKVAQAFTQREIEVLSLLGEGLPNKLIAHRLDLKEGTVKVHVRHIMKKLEVTSRTQAALFAQRHLLAESDGG